MNQKKRIKHTPGALNVVPGGEAVVGGGVVVVGGGAVVGGMGVGDAGGGGKVTTSFSIFFLSASDRPGGAIQFQKRMSLTQIYDTYIRIQEDIT